MADVLVELLVFVIADVFSVPCPERRRAVDALVFGRSLFLLFLVFVGTVIDCQHVDRQRNVVGVLFDDVAQSEIVREFFFTLFQMQRDHRTARFLFGVFEREAALAVGFPAHGLVLVETGAAAGHGHPVGNDEARVKPDAKLADHLRIFGLVAGQRLEEFLRTGARNGADVFDDFITRHADAVVRNRDGPVFLVEINGNLQVTFAFVQRLIAECFEAQLVAGIGRIRYQFAQKYFLVRIKRMGHQMQDLTRFGLKFQGFFAGLYTHLNLQKSARQAGLSIGFKLLGIAIAEIWGR